jgi:hypothetical protein
LCGNRKEIELLLEVDDEVHDDDDDDDNMHR